MRPTDRDKQIICGLYLAKYDQEGLQYLGFEKFTEAFNTLGLALRAKPASIKNYRDELDPYFPNPRMGWHKRPLRLHCSRVMATYESASMNQLGDVIKGFLLPDSELESIPEVHRVLSSHMDDPDSSFAKRLITGKAAEEYFVVHFRSMPEFANCQLRDTSQWGCGFDFKLTEDPGDSYSAVEVKGIRSRFGQIQLTSLEHEVAEVLMDRYYLVLVRNFAEEPFHTIIRNPLNSHLDFARMERSEVRVSWLAGIKA